MTQYFVDFNRGADGNNGTASGTPWKNLSKLGGAGSLAPAAGDQIFLAADSEWVLSTVLMAGNGAGWAGSADNNRVLLSRYDPTGSTPSDVLPIIEFNRALSSLTWAWDAGNLCWKNTSGVENGSSKQCVVMLDSTTFATCSTSAAVVKNEAGSFFSDAGNPCNIYMSTGSQVNDPGVVYPTGWIAPDSRSGLWFYDNGNAPATGQYLTVEKIKFRKTMGLVFSCTAAVGATPGLIVQDCSLYIGRLFAHACAAAAPSSFTVRKNTLEQVSTMGIWANGRYDTATIEGNTITSANLTRGKTQGAIYVQMFGGTNYIRANTITDAKRERGPAGLGLGYVDGSAVYVENGANALIVENNLVYNSCCAFHDNSGTPQTFRNNRTYGCNVGLFIDDAGVHGTMNCTVQDNQFLDCVPKTRFPEANIGSDFIHSVIYSYRDGDQTIQRNTITFAPDYDYNFDAGILRRGIYLEPSAGAKSRIVLNNNVGPGGASDTNAAGTYAAGNSIYVKTVGAGGSVSGNAVSNGSRASCGIGT